MTKIVGFACSLKLDWLNNAAQLLDENLTAVAYKNAMKEYLAVDIAGSTRLRKTCDILTNIWFKPNERMSSVRQEARNLLAKYPEYSNIIHWIMLCLAFPVVTDVCKFMGRLFEQQDVITNTILRKKLYDAWGERGTLQTTTRRITLTMKFLGLLEEPSKAHYKLLRKQIIPQEIVRLLIFSNMLIDNSTSYPFSSLSSLELLFPFDFYVLKEDLILDKRFMTFMSKGEMMVTLNGR